LLQFVKKEVDTVIPSCSFIWHQRDHWELHAGQWQKIGSPLRPSQEDIKLFTRAVVSANGQDGLLLGVTPELAFIGNMTALDHNPAMIDKLAVGKTVIGEWLDMPFMYAQFNFAIGDGSFNMLSYPMEYEQLFMQLKKVLKDGGRAIFRLFAAPEKPEPMKRVISAALSGEIKTFHAFKWRFAMALVGMTKDPNIKVSVIYSEFNSIFPDRKKLASASGWSRESIDTIDVYEYSKIVYSFPTMRQMQAVALADFHEISVEYGQYELAERCPVIIYGVNQ
jgi:SAM-dependent methyltransferase